MTKLEEIPNSSTTNLMEAILDKDNMNKAYLQVKRNGGAPGIDGLGVDDIADYLKENKTKIIEELLNGSYKPKPVKRVLIPKPEGGERQIGIPTVLDRIIQQSITQILSPIFEKIFSEHSYGFRPKRSCHMAILRAKEYIEEGYEYVVDIDLEKFFDTVNHNKLLNLIGKEIKDKTLLSLINKYLKSGIMIGKDYKETEEGTPQGGNLSPLLSNIMLHELDKELEKRGHKFCRYVDDCNIYVKSEKAGNRVMESISYYIEHRLKLKVNQKKSAVGSPYERKFLGFSFYKGKDKKLKIRVHPKSIKKLKDKVKKLMPRKTERSISKIINQLNLLVQGWYNYYKLDEYKSRMISIDGWIRRHLRVCIWKSWIGIKTRFKQLCKHGIPELDAIRNANTRKGAWRIAGSRILHFALPNEYLRRLGYIGLSNLIVAKI